jgi:ribonuclease BN (tRNA processing enzyme)
MRVCLLGTGSPAPLPERQGSALLISHDREHILVDAGRGATTQLVRAGVAPQDLGAVLITHHHYDHIGNLGDLLLTAWHGGIASLPVIGPPGTDAIVAALLGQVYQREIAFTLALARAAGQPMHDIHEVVGVTTITHGQIYRQGTWQVTAAAVEHGHSLGLSQEEWPCLGYRLEAGGKSVVVSGDTVACASLIELARGADALVHCCFVAEAALTTPYRRLVAEHVIASSGQVGKLATQAGVKRLILTHFNAMPPEMLAAIEADVARDFAGPLHVGEDLMAIDIIG